MKKKHDQTYLRDFICLDLALVCFLQVGIPHFCKTFSPAPVGKIKLTSTYFTSL